VLLSFSLLFGSSGHTPKPEPSDLVFAENKNQWADWVHYMGDLRKGKVILEQNKMSFLVNDNNRFEHAHDHTPQPAVKVHLMRIVFKGGNPKAALVPAEKQSYYRNYYKGNDPAHWASNVQLYKMVVYKEIYPGIDAEVFGDGDRFKYQFRVRPGADASQIALQYEGADNMQVKNGDLRYQTTVGDFTELAPVAYQSSSEANSAVKCKYHLDEVSHTVTFDMPRGYDHAKELVIDPTLVFASYTGSTADNWGLTATDDNAGNFYGAGIVFEYGNAGDAASGVGTYPTAGPFQSTFQGGDQDIAVTKWNATGTQLLYSTYLGGSGDEWPHSLIVDANNELYILGSSTSSNYPTGSAAYDRSYNGNLDIIVTKMSAAGNALVASTFVGGSGSDGQNIDSLLNYNYGDEVRGEIYIDSLSNVYVASSTASTNFPVTSSAFQRSYGGGNLDGCVFKMDRDLSTMLWCSYLGGSQADAAYSVKLDHQKSLIITGPTQSTNFTTTSGSLHSTYRGGDCDGYVCKISNDGTSLQASTFLGTGDHDQCFFTEIDEQNRIYVIGQSLGSYPVRNAGYSNSGGNQFIQVLSDDLSTDIRSTVFGSGGGQVNISPTAFLVDNCYNVYVAGWGGNVNQFHNPNTGFTSGLPVTAGAYKTTTDGSDMYFIVFKRDLSALLYGTYYGGNASVGEHVDGGTCRFDKNGTIYSAVCSGCGGNSLFPATPGAWSTTNRSLNCNYSALKFDINLTGTSVAVQAFPRATGCVPLTVDFTSVLSNVRNVKWDLGDGSTSTLPNPTYTYIDTGRYVVMLIGTDSNSCNIADTAYIDVWVRDDSLNADFSDSTIIDCYSKQITLTANTYPTSQYVWDFGDGNTSTANGSVTHVYNRPGGYHVSLSISDTSKCNLQADFETTVIVPPVVRINLNPTDTIGCIPLTIHFGNTTSSNGHYVWDFGNGDSSTIKDPTYTFTKGGHYTVTVSLYDSTTCNKTDQVVLHVFAIDSSADADFTVDRQFFFCDSVRVTVQSDYVGENWETWNFGDGFTSTANPVSHTYVGPTFDTITHIIYDSRKICKYYDTAQVIISLSPLQTFVAVPDTIGCVPFTTQLYGASPLLTTHYYWYFPGGDTAIGSIVQHTFSPTGTYQVLCISIDSNACVNLDSNYATIVVIDDSVHARFSIQTLNSCDSDLSIKLINSSTNATQYYWSIGQGTNSTAVDTAVHFYLPGTYTIKLLAVDTNRCHPRDSMTLTVTLKPNVIVDFTLTDVCLGQSASFVNLSDPKAQFQWWFGDASGSTLYSPSHLYAADGIYTVQLSIKDTSTCDVYDTIRKNITVYLQPIAAFSLAMDTYMFEKPVVFTNRSQYYNTSFWTFGDSTSSDENSPTHAYDHSLGWHLVCLEVYNAGAPCRDTICDSLFIDFKPLIGVPNAFSPNGDGINDEVRVEGKGIVELDFRIYNRWGQLVYEGTDPKQGWNGVFRGVPQEMEVYTYTVDARLINGDRIPLKGNITLLR
jgi:gliding motility-associated-like protein